MHLLASLRGFHEGWAWVAVISNGVAGAWCLTGHWVRGFRSTAMWWFTAFAELAMFVEVGLGVGMVAGQGVEGPRFHMFYGFLALIAIAILYSYRQQVQNRLYLLYGLGGLFVMGLGIRAMFLDR